MSSVVSYKTNASGQSHISNRSDLKSAASGYSRAHSAYSQKRKELLAQEQRKEMEDLVQKQLTEQERHKKLMLENKKRMKMQQEQLKKDLENKKQQEEDMLKKMKEDKKSAYMKYLKENSKELLQNFKKKEENIIPALDQNKNPKKANPAAGGYSYKQKPTSAEPLPPKHPRGKPSGYGGNPSKANNVNNNLPMAQKDFDKAFENAGMNEDSNLEALDLDFNRSTNNFKKIIDQYHKNMELLKHYEDQEFVTEGKQSIPLEQFYEKQIQQSPPQAKNSKLLESLDLSSSLTKWNPGKIQNNNNTFNNKKENSSKFAGYSKPKEEEVEKVEEYEEDFVADDGLEEEIEVLEDSFETDNSKMKNGREQKKLIKVSDLSEKQRKQDWHLSYLDNQSQQSVKQKSITPKVGASEVLENRNKDPKSLDHIPERTKTEGNQLKRVERNENKYEEKKVSAVDDLNFENMSPNKGFQQSTGLHFKWADELKDDDFYKGLDRQVPSRDMKREKIVQPTNQNQKFVEQQKAGNKKPPVYDSSSRKVNAMEADEGVIENRKVSAFEVKKPVSAQNQRRVQKEEIKEGSQVSKSKEPSVVGSNVSKKDQNGKENQTAKRGSGLRSRLESHVKASQQQQVNPKDKKNVGGAQGRRKTKSPTTKCTRDTDFDVEEFIKDDFQMLNQEEQALQREILDLQRKEIGKVREVEQKHQINTAYQNTSQLSNKVATPAPANKVQNEDALEESLERLDMMLSKQRNGNYSSGGGPAKNIPTYSNEPSLYQQVMKQPEPQIIPQQINHPVQQQPQYNNVQIPQHQQQWNQPPNQPYHYENPNAQYGQPHYPQTQPQNYMNQVNPNSYNQQQQYQQQYVPGGNMYPQENNYSPQFPGNYPQNQPPFNMMNNNPAPYQQQQQQQQPQNNQYQNVQENNKFNQYPVYFNPPPQVVQETGYSKNSNINKPPQNNVNPEPQGQYGQYGQRKPSQGEDESERLRVEKLKTFSFGNKEAPGSSNLQAVPEYGESLEEFEQFEKALFSDNRSVTSGKAGDKSTYSIPADKKMEATSKTGLSSGYGDKKQQPQAKGYAKKPPVGKQDPQKEVVNETDDGTVKVVMNTNLKHLLLND